jgi:hypothetical protein
VTPDEYRKIALGLPGAVEGSHMDHPDFRVGGKIFATLFKGNGVVLLTPEQQAALVKSKPHVFVPVNGGWGRTGSTTLLLQSADLQSVRKALLLAWGNKSSGGRSKAGTEKATSVFGKLATSLGRRDEVPNQVLAKTIAEKGDAKAVSELVAHLKDPDANIQSDCIKVLYEVGERRPSLIAPYGKQFLASLSAKNNRLVWGAMTALDSMTLEDPDLLHSGLSRITDVAETGSVITRDHTVGILVKLASVKRYEKEASELLVRQLASCPTNQLPAYAEKILSIANGRNREGFSKALRVRLGDIEKQSKKRRVEAVLGKLAE